MCLISGTTCPIQFPWPLTLSIISLPCLQCSVVIPPSHQSCAQHDCPMLKKFCPAWRERGQLTVFAPIPRHQCIFTAFSLHPRSIHHTPYHAEHHAHITLELRLPHRYRDQSDRVERKRHFHYAQATITAPQLRACLAFGVT